MSEIYLVLALGCTFGAVILFGIAADFGVSERRRSVKLLEAQVGQLQPSREGSNLREKDMARSFVERAVIPFVGRVGRTARRFTPLDTRDRIARKLVLAGAPAGWDAERIAALKVIGAVVGFVGGIILTSMVGLSTLMTLVLVGVLTGVGYYAADAILDR